MPPEPQPEPPKKEKKNRTMPILLTVVIILAVAVGAAYYMRDQGITMRKENHEAQRELCLVTNRYRSAGARAQDATVKMYQSVLGFANALAGTDEIRFFEEMPESPYIPNEEDDIFTEIQYPGTMGRVVVPSIGTTGPLVDCQDTTSLAQSVDYGFAIVDLPGDYNVHTMDEEGQTSILGHRCLTKTKGLYHMEELKEGDPFYVDDFRNDTRYHYVVKITDKIPEENINDYVFRIPGNERLSGQSVMLVVCDPMVYNVSTNRLLAYGELIGTSTVPVDDPYYQRFLDENGLVPGNGE